MAAVSDQLGRQNMQCYSKAAVPRRVSSVEDHEHYSLVNMLELEYILRMYLG